MSTIGTPVFRVDLEHTALLIVDMQNDFVRLGAPLEVPDARTTIGMHRQLLNVWRGRQAPVIFTRFVAGPKRTLMWNWSPQLEPPVCCCWPGHRRFYPDVEKELDCAAIIDDLRPFVGETVLDKYGYGAFYNTDLPDRLRALDVDTVVITGTVTQICVDETARGAFNYGFKAITVSDAVSSFAPDLHAATLKNLAMKFGRVATTAEVLQEVTQQEVQRGTHDDTDGGAGLHIRS
jgi:nicotinamidase-related amidase